MTVADELSKTTGTKAACAALGVSRATLYRHRRPATPNDRPTSPRALSDAEQKQVMDVLCSEPYVDASPAEVYAMLLEQGVYLCSVRSMYRVLHRHNACRERRSLVHHPAHKKPQLVATAPNQVWSWDITKVRGPGRGEYFHLYVILDIFSRKVTGWLLADCESALLAEHLIASTLDREGIESGQLVLHADRGSAMRSKTVADLLVELGVGKSHSRPRTSDDNAYSEAQFKTLKYSPSFPGRFDSIEEGRAFCRQFFAWYNHQHHHWGIALFTPEQVHSGQFEQVLLDRQAALDKAYEAHPERFVRGRPIAKRPPAEVYINRPTTQIELTGTDEPAPEEVISQRQAQVQTTVGAAGPSACTQEPG
jgi:transposase InsO family protein